MRIIAKHTKGKVLTNDGLAISAIAGKEKLKDPSVINATIGTLYDEDIKFLPMKTVDSIIRSMSNDRFYTYSPSDGGKEFQEAAMKWVFGKHYEKIKKEMYCKCLATPGGTGAVSNGLYNALDPHQTLLLPDIYWGPYQNMATCCDLEVVEYPFIVDGKFNLRGFIEYSEMLIAKQKKVATILNDPCNNPTGYSLTNEEFQGLIQYMNSKKDIPFFIIYDIAYFDYHADGPEAAREKFSYMMQANENVLFNIAFSCSKSFSVYGMRLGAQIIVGKSKDDVKEIFNTSCFLARTRWSNVSKAGINMLIAIDNNEDLKQSLFRELTQASHMVLKRAQLFTEEATQVGLKFYSYGGGFFMTVLCEDGMKLADQLVQEKIYVLGYPKAIRIAICSVPLNEIKGLAKRIKNTMDNLS